MKPLVLGAVAYDPKVVDIWEGFKAFFAERGLAFDYVLFSTYEAQVDAQLKRHIDVAWNSPLAWVQTKRKDASAEAIVMRDTDQDLSSVVLVRADGPMELKALNGKRVAVGAADSPQATLIPLVHLAEAGVEPKVVRHDIAVGKHGDHVGGERDAVKTLLRGDAEAACVIDGNHLAFTKDGTIPAGAVRVLSETGRYDHCNFTVLGGTDTARFRSLLLEMSFADPKVRRLMELEGLKAWKPGRTSGYALLERAVERFGSLK
jgi:ABC-type phosphate/phosphonate transport system substrate-binding protein